jgi:phosphate transport system substrate-binding protein
MAVPTVRMMCLAILMTAFAVPVAAGTGADVFQRDAISVLVSPLETAFTRTLSDRLVRKYDLPPLSVTTEPTAPAIKAFCGGIGAKFPDVIGIPRQMDSHEYDNCVQNGVVDIIELPVGFDALVLAVRKGDLVFNLTPRALYFALAAQIPDGDDFVPNSLKRWSDLDPRLPDLEINVVGSENGTSINAFFKEIFMEGGCRGLQPFKVFYSATDRVAMCTTLRDDGHFIPVKQPMVTTFPDVMEHAPRGAVAVIPYTVYRKNAAWLDLLPVLNVLPTPRTIKDDDYEAVSPVRYYVKRAHMEQSLGGTGVVRGLYSFIEELMSEDAIGPGGYLEAQGLVIDDPEDRQRDREGALRLQPFRP